MYELVKILFLLLGKLHFESAFISILKYRVIDYTCIGRKRAQERLIVI